MDNNIKIKIDEIFKTIDNICQLNRQFNAQRNLYGAVNSSSLNRGTFGRVSTTPKSLV